MKCVFMRLKHDPTDVNSTYRSLAAYYSSKWFSLFSRCTFQVWLKLLHPRGCILYSVPYRIIWISQTAAADETLIVGQASQSCPTQFAIQLSKDSSNWSGKAYPWGFSLLPLPHRFLSSVTIQSSSSSKCGKVGCLATIVISCLFSLVEFERRKGIFASRPLLHLFAA